MWFRWHLLFHISINLTPFNTSCHIQLVITMRIKCDDKAPFMLNYFDRTQCISYQAHYLASTLYKLKTCSCAADVTNNNQINQMLKNNCS